MKDIFKTSEECNSSRKCTVLSVFDDMMANIISNEKLNKIETELFIRRRKLKIYTVFVKKYFSVPNNFREFLTNCI